MVRYRVVVDRERCLGDMVCASICPEVFELGDDGKCQIKTEWRIKPENLAEGVVPKELYECVKAAADTCPIGVIRVEKLEE